MSLFSLCKVKPEVWHDINRVPVFPRKVNRWLLGTTAFAEPPTGEQLLQRAVTSMVLFNGPYFKDAAGEPLRTSEPKLIPKSVVESKWGKPLVPLRDAIPNPEPDDGLLVTYAIEFVSGGDLNAEPAKIGWPTLPECPFGVTDFLVAVYEPGGIAVTTPTDLSEHISQEARDAAEQITDPVVDLVEDTQKAAADLAPKAIATALVWGTIAAGSLLAFSLLSSSHQRQKSQ